MLLKRCDYSGIQISTEPNKNQNKQKKSHKLSVIKPVLHKTKKLKEKSKRNKRLLNSKEKMTCTYYNKDPLALVSNMDSYFKQIPPDCSLFSDDDEKVYCGNHRIASQFYDSLKELTELYGFPSRNFDFNGIILKSETQDPSDNKVSSLFIALNVTKYL